MLEGLDEALVGMTADETKQFTAPLAGGDQEGQDANCTVTVTAVKEREPARASTTSSPAWPRSSTRSTSLKADLTAKAEVDAKFAQGVAARDQAPRGHPREDRGPDPREHRRGRGAQPPRG